MADSQGTVKVVLDLDNKDFVKKLKDSLGLLDDMGSNESLSDLAGTFTKIGAVAGVTAVAILAVKSALDLTKEAEHIKQIENTFNNMAQSAGLSAEAIRGQLTAAVKGLADDTDVLQAGSRAILDMGNNAQHLGEVMVLARKFTAGFGGDLLQNFEGLSRALATGNERMLKQYGIILDTDKVTKEYAKSLGIGVEFLTDAGKKQAIFNAALDQGKEKLKNVDENVTGATQALTRMGVSFKTLGEIGVKVWDNLFGDAIRAVVTEIADRVDRMTKHVAASLGVEQDKKKLLEEQKLTLQEQLESYERMSGKLGDAMTDKIAATVKQIQALDQQIGELGKSEAKEGEVDTKVTQDKLVNQDKLLDAKLKFEKEIEDIRMKRIESDLQYGTNVEQAEAAYNEKKISMEREADLQIQMLKKDGLDKGVINQAQYADTVANIEQTLNDKLKNQELDLEQVRLRALENSAKASTTTAQGFSRGWAVEGKKAQMAMKNFSSFGATSFTAVKKNAVSAFEALGNGSKNAGEAMRGFLFGSIADIAQAQGELHLANGIASYNFVEAAEGGVLIALASALRSKANGASAGVGGGGGGGGGGGSSAASDVAGGGGADKPQAEVQHKKSVSVNIQGSYFETDQTRTRLMDMIRESGDFTDFNISTIGKTN